jgi:hypothetical protein
VKILVRQGEGPAAAYQRLHRERLEHERKVERICAEVAAGNVPTVSKSRIGNRSAEGDPRRLRGVPIFAKGVGGAVPGSNPLEALIAAEERAA